jgi:hypothetical protein
MKAIYQSLVLLFLASSASAAVFQSAGTGSYNSAASWTLVSGTDSDGLPDANDQATILTTHTLTLFTPGSAQSLTISNGAALNMNNQTFLCWGNLTNNGASSGAGTWQFKAPGTYSGNNLNNFGTVYFNTSYIIATGVVLAKNGPVIISSGATITNNGTVTLGSYIQFVSATAQWVNAVNSSLTVSDDFVGNGILNASANPNFVAYRNNGYNTVKATTYHHLELRTTAAATKSLLGNITVNGNFTINTGVTLNCANFQITLGGNWTNIANTNCTNMSTVSFNGSAIQTIDRTTGTTEQFRHIALNGSGTVLLNDSLNITGNLDINSGTLDLSASSFTINIQGDFLDNGTLASQQGRFNFNGSVAQTITGISTTNFYNININNAAGVSSDFTRMISNVLTIQAGSFGPTVFGSIIIPATAATSYGRIGIVNGTLTGTNWQIQGYVNGPATAYWQYLSTPANGNLLSDWDGDTRFYMSGVGGNDGNACCPIFRSVRTYNTAANTYTNITSISTPLAAGGGYLVWMADNLSSLTAPLIYDNRGIPNFGTINRAVVAGGAGQGYNLVGNPFACPINYSAVVTASGNLNANFVILQENGTYVTNPNGGVIGPSQGFMGVATSGGNMVFNESAKNMTNTPNLIRAADPENFIRIDVSNDVNGLGGQTSISLNDQARNGYDVQFDLPFLASPYEQASNIWTTDAEGKENLIHCLDANPEELNIQLSVHAAVAGNQLVSFRGLNSVTRYNCAYLIDNSNGQRINLLEQDHYSFYAEEAGSTRSFTLHLDRSGNCPMDQQNLVESLEALTQVYVNNDQLMIHFLFTEKTNVQVSVFDIEGREVFQPTNYNVAGETIALDSPGAHGIYFVRFTQGDRICTKKIYY